MDTAAQFSRQAEAYAESPGHAFDADLDILAAFAEAGQFHLCLDVATGPGHTAFRIAAKAGRVIGIDIAEGMLATARRLAAEREVTNVLFERADAAALPFQDATFDLVTCRIAPHHFHNIPAFLMEAARVLRPRGRLVLEDSLAPDDPEAAALLHWLEATRDPTHVKSLDRASWHAALSDAGFAVSREEIYHKRHDYPDWLARAGVNAEANRRMSERIRAAPEAIRAQLFEMDGEEPAYLLDQKILVRAEPA